MKLQEKPQLHILIGVSGSVAAIKLPQLVFELHHAFKNFGGTGFNVQIRVIVTKRGLYFLEKAEYYEDAKGLHEHFKNICIPYRIYKQREGQTSEMNKTLSRLAENEKNIDIQEQVNKRNIENMSSMDLEEMNEVILYEDDEEWESWKSLGDEVLHIALRNWADIFLIAPLSANTLAKLANGICDNLLTSVARAWGTKEKAKPFFIAPAMNTAMWEHPLTYSQINCLLQRNIYKSFEGREKIVKYSLKIRHGTKDEENINIEPEFEQVTGENISTEIKQSSSWKNEYRLIPPIKKLLACGDLGIGAMASIDNIVSSIQQVVDGGEYPHYYLVEANDVILHKDKKCSDEDKRSIKAILTDINGETCFHEGQLIVRKY